MDARNDVHEVIEKVEASPEFQEFSEQNPHHYLVHAFSTAAGAPAPIELGYYGEDTDMITVFRSDPITAMPPEEVFKQDGKLKQLDLTAVRLGLKDALERAEKERAAAYPQHATIKAICILQQHDNPTWNLTLVTGTMQMINMRIDALTGQVLSRSIQSIMNIARE